MIHRHICFISGAFQDPYKSGFKEPYIKLFEDDETDAHLIMRQWSDSVSSTASHIRTLGGISCGIVAFSYGCQTAANLCDELARNRIFIPFLILVDPVRRVGPLNIYSPLKLISLCPKLSSVVGPIRINNRADKVIVFRQHNALPYPWPVQVDPDRTVLEEIDLTERGYSHVDMDNAPEVCDAVIRQSRASFPRR